MSLIQRGRMTSTGSGLYHGSAHRVDKDGRHQEAAKLKLKRRDRPLVADSSTQLIKPELVFLLKSVSPKTRTSLV